MYQLMINRKNSKKGFTLVEVIVVLVILAILAAIMIPAMTGWIDKAKEKAIVVEARSALLAAQAVASELYATKTVAAADITDTAIKAISDSPTSSLSTVTGVDGTARITGFTYENGGKLATYAYTSGNTGTWTITDK